MTREIKRKDIDPDAAVRWLDVYPEAIAEQFADRPDLALPYYQRHPFTCADCPGKWWTHGGYLDHFARLDLPPCHPAAAPKASA